MKGRRKMFTIISIVILVCIYLFIQNNILETTIYTVQHKDSTEALDGLKICQVSDFHNSSSNILKKDLVRKLKEEKPDIIAITGDLIDYRNTNTSSSLEFVGKIKDIAPIYYVTGNHEAAVKKTNPEEYEKFEEGMKELGVVVLENETSIIEHNGAKLNIIGINDVTMDEFKGMDYPARAKKQLELAGICSADYTILLAHRPDFLDIYAKHNIDLVLSGHHHGGQVRFFGQGLISSDRELFPDYTSGVKTKDNTTIVLSRGTGNSVCPTRINNRPELVTVVLKAA